MRTLCIAVTVLMVGASGALGTAPSPSLITFQDDFNGADLDSNKWSTGVTGPGPGVVEFSAAGLSGGSLRISTTVADEAYGRPNIKVRPPADGWVTDFDFKFDSAASAGDYFILYAAYAPHATNPWPSIGSPVDVEIGLGPSVFTSSDLIDLTVYAASGGTGGGTIDTNLEWDQWYHFTVHRVFATGVVDVYVDDNLIGSYSAYNSHLRIGDAQIGDPGNVQYGIANWDNFSIGSSFSVIPPPTLTDVTVSDTVNMTFDSTTGATYAVEFAESGTPTNWTPTGLVITGDGTTRFASDPAGAGTTRLYRLDVLGQ